MLKNIEKLAFLKGTFFYMNLSQRSQYTNARTWISCDICVGD